MGRIFSYSKMMAAKLSGLIWRKVVPVLVCCLGFAVSCDDGLPLEPADRFNRSGSTKSVMSYTSSRTSGLMTVRAAAKTVSDIDRIYVTTTRGSVGSESLIFQNEVFSWNGSRFVGQTKWPSQASDYRMYAASVPMEYRAGGTVLWADGTSDVVCGYCGNPTWGAVNNFTFTHVFGILGDVTLMAEPGWTLSNLSVTIDAVTGGTYDVRKGALLQDPWTDLVSEESYSIIPASAGTREVSLFLIPGTYQVNARWRAINGSSVCDYSDMSALLEISAGNETNVTITLGGEMTLSVDIASWDTPSINVSETS